MMGGKGLFKPNAANIYDTIGNNAPVVKVADVEKKEVVQPVQQEQKAEPVQEEKTAAAGIDLLNPKKQKKTASIYLRCKPEIKEKFDKLCKDKGISQADMFEFWVDSLLK